MGKIVLVDGKWKDEESFVVEEWKVMGDNTGESTRTGQRGAEQRGD